MTRAGLLALLFPRRCPFCDRVLGDRSPQAAFCQRCASEEQRLRHTPPRLPETEHLFYSMSGAAAAYYYTGCVRAAVLRCKLYQHPWYARELADRMAVCLWGAAPAGKPGGCPVPEPAFLPRYSAVVPVPPRKRTPGVPELPLLLAGRLGKILDLPVVEALAVTKELRPQKSLDRDERVKNVKGAYAVRKGVDLEGQRILLVDDVITTGATISACADALMQGGAEDVFAVCIAAAEELPKEKQHT